MREEMGNGYYRDYTIVNSKIQGWVLTYSDKGHLWKKEHYKDGKRDGISTTYYEDGTVMLEVVWEKGKDLRATGYNQDGSIKFDKVYRQPSKEWSTNPNVKWGKDSFEICL